MHQEKAALSPCDIQAKNKQIEKTYFKILKEVAELSRSFPDSNYRVRIEIDLKHYTGNKKELFELLTPYVYLQLNRNDEGRLSIAYAVNDNAVRYLGKLYFSKLMRIIYSHTTAPKLQTDDCLEAFPYYSEIYQEARHFTQSLEEEDPYYKFIQEEFKG